MLNHAVFIINCSNNTRVEPLFQPVFRILAYLIWLLAILPVRCFFKDNNFNIHDICLSISNLGISVERLQDWDIFLGLFLAGSVGQCGKEVPNFLVNLLLGGNGLGDFITQKLTVAVA